MDALSDILRSLRFKSCVYFEADLPAPWGMTAAASPFAQFHLVVRGDCWLQLDGASPVRLGEGDVAVLTRGDAHWLADSPNSPRTPAADVVPELMRRALPFHGDGPETRLLCGHFELRRETAHPFVEALPELIHLTAQERRRLTWLEAATTALIDETGSTAPGSEALSERLAEGLFIQTLRAHIERSGNDSGFLAALADAHVGAALRRIHAEPGESWSVPRLASEVGMSRSVFAARFVELVGEGPIQYLSRWRLLQARDGVIESRAPLAEIAGEAGFSSEAAFNRAFKRCFGDTPGRARRQARLAGTAS